MSKEEIQMPRIIAAFVKAKNNRDHEAVVACFASNATVHDEGNEMRGATAIREWSDNTSKKYQFTIDPTEIVEGNNETILTATLTGNFPGSPVSLDFHFNIEDDLIATLTIK
jgi:ketosteroid isomerase-like protein